MASQVTIVENSVGQEEVDFDEIKRLNESEENVAMFDVSYHEYLHDVYEEEHEDDNVEEKKSLTSVIEHEDLERSLKVEENEYFDLEEGFREYDEDEDFEKKEQKEDERTITSISSQEKGDEEIQPLESEQLFFEIPAEVLEDREAMISKLKELRMEQPTLKRKNKLLEFWVVKHMAQTNQKIIPNDVSMQIEELQIVYRNSLRDFQQNSDRILALRNQLQMEVDNYENKVQEVVNRGERAYEELLNEQKLIGVGLIFSKSAKKLTEVQINDLIRNQILHREMLINCRINYIRLHTRLEGLTEKLSSLNQLGPGKNFFDYQLLRNTNGTLKEKVDEQICDADKLRDKIHEALNRMTYFKEKDLILTENLDEEWEEFDKFEQMKDIEREHVNKLRLQQIDLVNSIQCKQEGCFVDIPQIESMNRAIKTLQCYKDKISILENNIKKSEKKRRRSMLTNHQSSSLTMSETKSGFSTCL